MALQNREKKMLKILAVVAVLGAVSLYFTLFAKDEEPVVEQTTAATTTTAPAAGEKKKSSPSRPSSGGGGGARGGSSGGSKAAPVSLSFESFQSHNTAKDCWVLVDGSVYDITGLVSSGSIDPKAAEYCGTTGFEIGFLDQQLNIKDSILTQSQKVGKIG